MSSSVSRFVMIAPNSSDGTTSLLGSVSTSGPAKVIVCSVFTAVCKLGCTVEVAVDQVGITSDASYRPPETAGEVVPRQQPSEDE